VLLEAMSAFFRGWECICIGFQSAFIGQKSIADAIRMLKSPRLLI
jgi:hypothetical protein